MARSISSALKAHLAQTVTTLATLWTITRQDGTVFCLTDHDRPITIDGLTFLSSFGFQRTAIATSSDLSVNNLDLVGVFDNVILKESDLTAGLFDFADVRIQVCNWADATMGTVKLLRGTLGSVATRPSGMFQAELRGMAQRLQQKIVEVFTPDCRADLGDIRCKIPIEPPVLPRVFNAIQGAFYRVPTDATHTDSRKYQDRIYQCTTGGLTATAQPVYDTAPGNSTDDGDAVLLCNQSWTRSGAVLAVTDSANFTVSFDTSEPRSGDGWFAYGVITWESGNNIGRSMELKAWTNVGGIVRLFLPMDQPIQVGDRFRLPPGCDKLLSTCFGKFANVTNMRAEPYLMGNDALFSYPNAQV